MNKKYYPLREENLITKHILHVKFHAKHTAIPFFHKRKIFGGNEMCFSNILWQISHVTWAHSINTDPLISHQCKEIIKSTISISQEYMKND